MSRWKFVLRTLLGASELGIILEEHMRGSHHEILFQPKATWSQWKGECGHLYVSMESEDEEDPGFFVSDVVLVKTLEVWGPWVVVVEQDLSDRGTTYVLAGTSERQGGDSLPHSSSHTSGMWWTTDQGLSSSAR